MNILCDNGMKISTMVWSFQLHKSYMRDEKETHAFSVHKMKLSSIKLQDHYLLGKFNPF